MFTRCSFALVGPKAVQRRLPIDAESLPGVVGLGEQLVGGAAVAVLGGGDSAAQEEGAVDRQGFGSVGGNIPV